MVTMRFRIAGMHCASCKALIEEACAELAGVSSCTVDLERGEGVAEHDGTLDLDTLRKELAALGDYKVELL